MEAARQVLGDKASKVTNALALSEQIGPILASGTKGNPRQIKRFLNSLFLRQSTAVARGFGDDIKLPVLAKLMLAERFLPRFFDQIAEAAANAADGKCKDLALLEASLTAAPPSSEGGDAATAQGAHPAAGANPPSDSSSESSLLSEWISSPDIHGWAKVQVPLAEVDLRPYLFVAKDRKDYFAVSAGIGHLGKLLEQLFGPKMAVQGLGAELRQLSPSDGKKLIEAMRGRILASDAFETEPAGISGLSVLVKNQPSLQSALIELLETLPTKRLGPWACKGWEGAFVDQEIAQRFSALLQAWSKEGSPVLKTAAALQLTGRSNR